MSHPRWGPHWCGRPPRNGRPAWLPLVGGGPAGRSLDAGVSRVAWVAGTVEQMGGRKVLSYHDVILYEDDVKLLEPRCWLNDQARQAAVGDSSARGGRLTAAVVLVRSSPSSSNTSREKYVRVTTLM